MQINETNPWKYSQSKKGNGAEILEKKKIQVELRKEKQKMGT